MHVEGYKTKLQARAWERVLIPCDSDKPIVHVYVCNTGRARAPATGPSSKRRMPFFQRQTPRGKKKQMFPISIRTQTPISWMTTIPSITALHLWKRKTTAPTHQKTKPRRIKSKTVSYAATIIYFTGKGSSANTRMPRTPRRQFESITQYIDALGMGDVQPPASISVPNIYAQLKALPQTEEWEAAMHKELHGLDAHEAAD